MFELLKQNLGAPTQMQNILGPIKHSGLTQLKTSSTSDLLFLRKAVDNLLYQRNKENKKEIKTVKASIFFHHLMHYKHYYKVHFNQISYQIFDSISL